MYKETMRKLTSGTLSAVMALSPIACASGTLSADAANAIISSEFDSGRDNWSARGNTTLSNNSQSYYSGTGSLMVSGRMEKWNGAQLSLPQLRPGGTYSFSAAVMHKNGSDISIKMTLQYQNGGMEIYDRIAELSVKSGQWTDLSNVSYTIPSGAVNPAVCIESPDSLADIYIDSFTAADSGTPSGITTGGGVVDGIGSKNVPTVKKRGDFSGDGKVNSFDLTEARDLLIKQFSGSMNAVDLEVADIDGNGAFAMSDVLLLSKYIMGQKDAFPEVIQTTTTTVPVTTAQDIVTTTTTSVTPIGGDLMDTIANDMVLKAPADFTQMRPGVDYGTMEKKSYFSKDGNMTKNMNVLLPPGYDASQSYPVLYVLHGIFGDENSMPGMGIQTMLGNLIADGKAEKMIVVFPAMFTGSGMPGFDSEAARKYDLIREDIENSIMPFLEENYSVKTGRENTAITGFSMGGREALYTGVSRSEKYGYIGAACPAPGIFATRDNFMEHLGCMQPSEFKPAVAPKMLLISAAAFDGTVGQYPQTYHEALEANGAKHLWQVIPDGDHGGNTVTPHMYNFLRYVFK